MVCFFCGCVLQCVVVGFVGVYVKGVFDIQYKDFVVVDFVGFSGGCDC